MRRAKRNKAFDDGHWIGLAIDGTGAGWRTKQGCSLCRPQRNANKGILGYQHSMVLISVVGTGLSLPCDVEPYGPGDSAQSDPVWSPDSRYVAFNLLPNGGSDPPFLVEKIEVGTEQVQNIYGDTSQTHQHKQSESVSTGPESRVKSQSLSHASLCSSGNSSVPTP